MAEGKRFSKQRETIIQMLKSVTSHPTADMVYAMVREQIPNISLGTVYRNLKALASDGEILSFTLDGKERFDGNINPHIHLCCSNCGKVTDEFKDTEEIKKKCLDKQGFLINNIVINGVCKDCLNK